MTPDIELSLDLTKELLVPFDFEVRVKTTLH